MSIQPSSSWINWEVQLPNGDITNDADGTYCIIEDNPEMHPEPPSTDHFLIPDGSADDAIQVGEWKVVKMSQVSQVNTSSKKPSTTASEKVKCKVCAKSFSSSNYLKDHMRTHTGEKPFQCAECDLAFAQKCNLRMHQRVHSGERPFMCGICGRTFNRSSHLKGHMLQHTGDKPFKCETCGHRFTNAQGKKNHMRLHIGEQPFQCELCGANFNEKSVLKLHVKQHGKESRYSCTICRRKFLLRSSLFEHMTFHSSSKLHTCNQCHKRFKQKHYLQKHKTTSCSNKSFIDYNPDMEEGSSNDVSKLKYRCLKTSEKANPLDVDSEEEDMMDFCIERVTKRLSLTDAQESRLKYISNDEDDYLDKSYMKLLKRVGFVQDI